VNAVTGAIAAEDPSSFATSAVIAAITCCFASSGMESVLRTFLAASRSVFAHCASVWPTVPHMRTFDCLRSPLAAVNCTLVSNLWALHDWARTSSTGVGSAAGSGCDAG
jgi:hypothetical protein